MEHLEFSRDQDLFVAHLSIRKEGVQRVRAPLSVHPFPV